MQDEAYQQACQHMLQMGQLLWAEKREGRDYRSCIAQTLLGKPDAIYSAF